MTLTEQRTEEAQREIRTALTKHSFKALKATLQPQEAEVLNALLEINAAVTVNAIRSYLVKNLAGENKEAILAKYGIQDIPAGRPTIKYIEGRTSKKEPRLNERLKDAYDKASEFNVNLEISFLDEDVLRERGIIDKYPELILNTTQKIEIWIQALQGIVDVPSVKKVEEILEFLHYSNLIDKRALAPGSRAKDVWFVKPEIVDLRKQ